MDLWRDIYLDTFTGLRASAACNQNNQYLDRALTIAVNDPAARAWLTTNSDGIAWAKRYNFPDVLQFYPQAECAATDPRPILAIDSPSAGAVLTGGSVEIRGRAGATAEFDHYLVEYGKGADPRDWFPIGSPSNQQVTASGRLAEWDLQGVDSGQVTIRLSVFSKQGGGQASVRIVLTIQKPLPTATSTPTITPTGTPTATPTATPTDTLSPTALVPTITETETPMPTDTPSPTDTPTPTETPT
jgi:hypothetical protein